MFTRDSNRCVLTGLLSTGYFKDLDSSDQAELDKRDQELGNVQCAHIIPHVLDNGLANPDKVRFQLFTSLTDTLTRFSSHATRARSEPFLNDGAGSSTN